MTDLKGLSAAEVTRRRNAGLDNREIDPPTKTVGQIFQSHIFTYFNAIFVLLAIGVIIAGSFKNLTFMVVVIANTAIGIVQELKSKRTLDQMSLLTERTCTVIRDGQKQTVGIHHTVQGDLVLFTAGAQIFADALVVDGEAVANEALITGEADEIPKHKGDRLISGSFLMSGRCYASLTAVGADSFASKLTLDAKRAKKRGKSEMMLSLTRLVKIIGIALIPLGAAMLWKEIGWLGLDYREGIISTVAALVGMIPEGLYLLTSLALVTSVVRLTQRKTLVHEMDCIETLARVDTLCVDKTGTITENKMTVEDTVPLDDSLTVEEIEQWMADYVFAHQADNDTMTALKKYYTGSSLRSADYILPFTSSRKYGAAHFSDGAYLLGAPDILLAGRFSEIESRVAAYSEKGCRVLLLAKTDGDPETLTGSITPLALILLTNKIRRKAPETFHYFAQNGVDVKVISGDNPVAVAEVARRAGIVGCERFVDARTLDTDEKLSRAAVSYTVFGRVTPEQKRTLIRALHAAGHTVAMTGDGVNDVLALKEADCSIAMASGSEIAAQASDIVLLHSQFTALPSVVAEGRRVINNIERSASLYLWKNIFSFVLALITLLFTLPYPLEPSQLSLISALTIGFPSFVLALEPNRSLVHGHFLKNVLHRALPAAISGLFMVIGVMLFYLAFDIPKDEISTVCAMILGLIGLLMLFSTSRPFNRLRAWLFVLMAAALLLSAIVFADLFSLVPLSFGSGLILTVFLILSVPTYMGIHTLLFRLRELKTFLRKKLIRL